MTTKNVVRPLLIVGTRPEAIKMAPLIQACRQRSSELDPIVCFTGQHRELLQQVAAYFGIEADVDLDVMRPNQTLSGLMVRCLAALDSTMVQQQPDCIVAQGDTTTVMAAAMAAFHRRLPFVHVEAGLRTGDLQSPWPEEYNRRVAGITADVHCAPTERAANNLLRESIAPQTVRVTGNTVVDALLWTVARERRNSEAWNSKYRFLEKRRMILITGHRRENFGAGFDSICQAIVRLAQEFHDVAFVYPVHLNPNVREPVHRWLGAQPNVHLVDPAPYPEFVWLMDRSTFILTDSGGVQEEAPSLRKPVLVTRDTTERPEAVEAGAVEIVGTNIETIVTAAARLLRDDREYVKRQVEENPYGDGLASQRIADLIVSRSWLDRRIQAEAA